MNKCILVSVALLTAVGCKKSNTPRDSNERGEYFNCEIDGVYWTYKEPPSYSTAENLQAIVGDSLFPQFKLYAKAPGYPRTIIEMRIVGKQFPDRDTFELSAAPDSPHATILGPSFQYAFGGGGTTQTHTGRIVFSKRTRERVEGTFYFDAYWADSNRVFRVRDGRFAIIPE